MTLQTPTPAPQGTPKAAIFKQLSKFNEKTVRRDMNEIIAKYRGVPIDEAKFQRVLKPGEVNRLMELYQ
jgi:hypothetical protein